MKKFLAVILCLVMACGVFAACSKKDTNKNDPAAGKSTSGEAVSVVTTDDAVIKEADAINLIRAYNAKELSLSDDDYKNCKYLVNKSGVKIQDDYYIGVVAAIMSESKGEDGKTYVHFDHKGEYYIRYDGKKILKKDMSSKEDKFEEMKVKEVSTTQAPTESTTK